MKVQSITSFQGFPSMYRGRQTTPSTTEILFRGKEEPTFKGRLIYSPATAFKAYPKGITSEEIAETFRILA